MINQNLLSESPLSLEDLQKIEDTNFSPLERHYLRLLAHCLACFQSMAQETSLGPLPSDQNRLDWCLQQPSLARDKNFIHILLEQLSAAASQLEEIACKLGVTPLELTLTDLLDAYSPCHPSTLKSPTLKK